MKTNMKEGVESQKKRQQNRAWVRTLSTTTDRNKKNEAAAGLFAAFYKPLSNWFNTNVGKTSDVRDIKDLVQITLEKVFSKASMYTPDSGEVSTWIYKVALNTLLDHKRKWRGKDVISIEKINEAFNVQDPTDTVAFELRAPERTPDVLAEAEQAHAMVRTTVASMKSQKERRMLELRFFEERTYEEIAHEMEMPIGTVKALLFRAKENFKKMLPQEDMVTA